MCAADAILSAVNSHWQTPEHGNLIFDGLDGHGARDPVQAFAAWHEPARGGLLQASVKTLVPSASPNLPR
jgi:hypothetical protein